VRWEFWEQEKGKMREWKKGEKDRKKRKREKRTEKKKNWEDVNSPYNRHKNKYLWYNQVYENYKEIIH
jgi:hypothetical protein